MRDEEGEETPFCLRCKEDFPVAREPARWSMGEMRRFSNAPRRIQEQFRDWLAEELHEAYLCGNCYFDLTD